MDNDIDHRKILKEKIDAVDGELKGLADVMRVAIFSKRDNGINEELAVHVVSEKPPENPNIAFKERNKVRIEKEEIETAQKEWDIFRDAHAGDEGFDLDSAHAEFVRNSADKIAKNTKGGFWAKIVRIALGRQLSQKIKKDHD